MHKRRRSRLPGILQLFIKNGAGALLMGSGNVNEGQGETGGEGLETNSPKAKL